MILAEYYYAYGAGCYEYNRRLQFTRSQNGGDIHISVQARTGKNSWREISRLNGDDVNVEMMSTSKKVEALQKERRGEMSSRIPDKKLSALSSTEQENILSELEPNGSRRIEITNDFGEDPKFEKIAYLCIFDPS